MEMSTFPSQTKTNKTARSKELDKLIETQYKLHTNYTKHLSQGIRKQISFIHREAKRRAHNTRINR